MIKKNNKKQKNKAKKEKCVVVKYVMHPYISPRMMILLCRVDVTIKYRPWLKIVAVVRHVRPQSGRSLILGHM